MVAWQMVSTSTYMWVCRPYIGLTWGYVGPYIGIGSHIGNAWRIQTITTEIPITTIAITFIAMVRPCGFVVTTAYRVPHFHFLSRIYQPLHKRISDL